MQLSDAEKFPRSVVFSRSGEKKLYSQSGEFLLIRGKFSKSLQGECVIKSGKDKWQKLI